MNATRKSYTISDTGYTEKQFGELPGLEWVDENGYTNRSIAVDINLPLVANVFRVSCERQILVSGEWKSDIKKNFTMIADGKTYRNTQGQLILDAFEPDPEKPITKFDVITQQNIVIGYEQKLKAGLIAQNEFFVKIIGYNVTNTNVSLFQYVYRAMAERLNLNLIP